jgi:sensor histidine kinase YesM
METVMKPTSSHDVVATLLYTLGFNTVIAVLITLVGFGQGFMVNLIMSQCIGCSICGCVALIHCYFHPDRHWVRWVALALTLVVGGLIGTFMGAVLSGIPPRYFLHEYGLLIRILILSAIFGAVISYFFSARGQLSDSREKLQEERILRLSLEKQSAETQLRLLQAQVEPHFLFNTLSNVLSLIDTDREKAKTMLSHLSRYLRTSLARSRMPATTLSQEMEMIRSYIRIFKIRMGDRLCYDIDIPDSLADVSLPPMLIQPLVENAILHGLEPKLANGKVTIKASINENTMRIEVEDNGRGLHETDPAGTGLSNVRERLGSLFGNKGRLILKENPPSGVKAIIEFLHATH